VEAQHRHGLHRRERQVGQQGGRHRDLHLQRQAVSFVTTTGPTRGIVDVAVDGTPVGSVDLYAAKAHKRQVVWSHSFATSSMHTLTLTVEGTSGRPRVDVDAFLVAV